jgi:NDP-sugar pyrophosphorylase family protein
VENGVVSESVNWLYPKLLRENSRSIAAFVSDVSFRDIGTPADCLRTSLDLAAVEGDSGPGRNARVDATAVIDRCSLWDDVTIGPGVRLTECIVADGVQIPRGRSYQRSAIVQQDGALIVHSFDRA